MNKILLENFKTSLSDSVVRDKRTILQKIYKYIKNPIKIFPRILMEFKEYDYEINWDQRTEKMGKSSVFGNQINNEEQKKNYQFT